MSEGHAGCQLNGRCDGHRKWNSPSWREALFIRASKHAAVLRGQELSFVSLYMFVCVCVRCPSAMTTIQKWLISVQAAGSRWRGSSSPGHMPTAWAQSWQRPTPTPPQADVPSCAIAAVLVVAAGLVCCRPTIGQRGIQCGGIGRTRASLKLESLFNFSDS